MSSWRALIPVPTGRFAAAAAALAVVAGFLPLRTVPALLAVNGALVAVAVVDALLAVPARGLDVTRSLPDVVALGDEATISWRVTNPTRRRAVAELADELAPSLRAGTRRIRVSVPAAASATISTTIRPSRRGRFTIDELAVRVAGPVGLAARQQLLSVPATLRVYPSFASRDEAELRITKARILEVGLRSAKGRGGGTDFDSLREYAPDDEFRRIDWAATARTARPVVRTYHAERNQTVLLLLDTGRVMAGQVAGVPRLDHAMDAVMALTTVTTRLGDRAGLIAFDTDVRAVVPPSHARGQLGRVTEAMFELEPRLVESDYAAAFADTLARFRRRALLVVLSDLAEQAIQDTLLPALPLIARDHLVVLASVTDPEVVAWADAVTETAGDAYRAAAAVAALEQRRRVAARLRGAGVTVVDEPPQRLPAALADTYLKAKATGRL